MSLYDNTGPGSNNEQMNEFGEKIPSKDFTREDGDVEELQFDETSSQSPSQLDTPTGGIKSPDFMETLNSAEPVSDEELLNDVHREYRDEAL